MIAAGARGFGPLSPPEALQNLNERAPDQAFGRALIMNRWGSLVGWSTLAARALAILLYTAWRRRHKGLARSHDTSVQEHGET